MSTKTLVINLTRTAIFVDVRHADDRLDTVQIQERGRVHIGLGQRVDPKWLEHNPDVVAVHIPPAPPQPVQQPEPVAAVAAPEVGTDDTAEDDAADDTQPQEGGN